MVELKSSCLYLLPEAFAVIFLCRSTIRTVKSHTRCESGPENPESTRLSDKPVCAQIAGMPVRHLYTEDKLIYLISEIKMNRMKLSLLVLMLAGYMNSASAVGPGYLGNLSGNTYSIGHTFSALTSGSPFVDTYVFDIAPQSVTVGTTVTINLDLPFFTGPEFELSNMSIKFTDATGATIYDADSQTNVVDSTLSVFATLPAALGYKFVVAGDVTGNLGGSYGGVLQALPIPEPETYSMLLAGLGLMGAISRRCKIA